MPNSLLFVVVAAVFFGVFGVMAGLGGCLGAASMMAQPSYSLPAELEAPFVELMSMAETMSWVSATLGLLLQLPVAALLLAGAGLTVYRHPLARRVLGIALVAAPLVEVVVAVYGLGVQYMIIRPTMALLDVSLSAPSGSPLPPWVEYIPSATMLMVGIGALISLAWVALKLAIYIVANRQLRKDKVNAWFEANCSAS